MTNSHSLLELLLPAGWAERIRMFGSACPPDLAPTANSDGDADLVVVAPRSGAEESADSMAREAVASLRPGGVAVVIGTARVRRAVERSFMTAGIASRFTLVHTRVGAATALCSVEGGALQYAESRVAAVRARVSSAPLVGGGAARLGVATLVLAEKDSDLAGWLHAPGAPAVDGIVLRPSWRGPSGTAVVTGIAAGRPVVFGKLGLEAGSRTGEEESDALTRLGGGARSAGAVVPELLGLVRLGDRSAALLSPVPGRPIAADIHGRAFARAAAERVAAWLGRWCSATRVTARVARAVTEEVETPLAELDPELGQTFPDEVRRLAARMQRDGSTLCARHGDLTLWNVLDAGDDLGIIDWEGAQPQALPLTDLPYLLVDAITAGTRHRDRVRAYAACFTPGGVSASWASSVMARTAAAAGIADHELQLAQHACWLAHAANERRRGLTDGPFLRILRRHVGSRR